MEKYDESAAAMWNAYMGREPLPKEPKKPKEPIARVELVESFRFAVQGAIERRDAGQSVATVILHVDAAEALLELIDAPIVHARWDDGHCTNCGRSCLNDYGENEYESDYCPHCGATMEAEEG